MSDANKPKRKHLGRGLESLLGPIIRPEAGTSLQEPAALEPLKFPPDKQLSNSIMYISISQIRPNPYQPRTTWNQEGLNELADSIRQNGLIQPILVRQAEGGFEVIAGERRLRAAQQAGLDNVPAIVRAADDSEMLELALVENIHRADLNPIERAGAYRRFIETFSLTHQQAADRLGQDRSVITNYLRLLELPELIKQMLTDGSLSMGHARAILALPDDELKRKLANRAMAGRLSVREVERLVRRYLEGKVESKKEIREKPAHLADLENRLRQLLGTKVSIETVKKGDRGRIIIEFYSLDEFDSLTERMGLSGTEEL